MRRRGLLIALVMTLVAAALVLAACGDGDDEGTTTSPAATEAPSGTGPPGAGALPPEVAECFADRGYEPEEIHSAPQEVLQACFGH